MKTFKQMFEEAYTYLYPTVVDRMVIDFQKDVEYQKLGIKSKINDLKEGEFNTNAYVDRTDNAHYNRLVKWLELFHESEYKLHKLKSYGEDCSECVLIINKVFEYIRQLFYLSSQKWLISHNCVNDFFNFRELEISDWDEIEGWQPSEEEQQIYNTPLNWDGNTPDSFEVYRETIQPLQAAINKAKTPNEKVICITMVLNASHHNGPFLDYGVFDVEDLDRLSNLSQNLWDIEIYKEFGIYKSRVQ